MNSISWQGFSSKVLRTLFSVAMVAFWTACADDSQNLTGPDADAASAKGKPTGSYSIIATTEGNTVTITVNQPDAQNASHLLLQFKKCNELNEWSGDYITSDDVLASSLNPTYTIGNGTGCAFNNTGTFIKFETLPTTSTFTFTITLDEPVFSGEIIVKSGRSTCTLFSLLNSAGENPFSCVDENNHETAFAKGDASTCFLNIGFNRWGWTNQLIGEGEYTMPVYAGAAQCDITDRLVGSVTITYTAGTVTALWNIDAPHELIDTHLYAGTANLPLICSGKKCTPTVAPGAYTVATGLTGPIWVVAHAVVNVNN